MRDQFEACHGWKRRAAELLGIDPSVISRALAPRSNWKLSKGVAEQVSQVTGIPPEWFESGEEAWQRAASWSHPKRPHEPFVFTIAELERAAQSVFTHHARSTLSREHSDGLIAAWAELAPVQLLLDLGPASRRFDPAWAAELAEFTLDFVQATREAFDASRQREIDTRTEFVEVMSRWAR